MAGFVVVYTGNTVLITFESDTPSRSFGTPVAGRLEHGKRLPTSGPNFRAYSRLGALLGRNSVHGAVRATVLEAYATLRRTSPDQLFVYGETGWPHGGPFLPHRTHQNGLSVDFMVPLRSAAGQPVPFPTSVFTRFGYGLEFDAEGRKGSTRIDFEAIARHLLALQEAAPLHGLRIARVIITPEYQPVLFATPSGLRLKGMIPMMTTPAWVRHDEHYHVDFALTPPVAEPVGIK